MSGGATSTGTGPTGSTPSTQHEGGIARFFENLFGSDEADDRDADRSTYTEAFNRGSYGLTVRTSGEDEIERAQGILNAAGAIDIDERSETWRKEGWSGASDVDAATMNPDASKKLQEVQEELKVGKRVVNRGGVRVFTRVTEVPVEESVTLREEHADIKRTAVDRVATAADLDAFKEGSIEIREMSEEAVVSKTARVTGEVEIGKTATEREETIRDTVRQTRVDVEKLAADDTAATSSKQKP